MHIYTYIYTHTYTAGLFLKYKNQMVRNMVRNSNPDIAC